MKILIFAALNSELVSVKNHLNNIKIHKSAKIDFLKTGIGTRNIKSNLTALLKDNKYKYDYIINTGTAGSLKDELHVGEVFIPNTIEYFEKREKYFFDINHNFKMSKNWITGILVTSDKDIINTTDKKNLKAKTKADAVDMEAYEAAKVSKKYNIPFISIKVISDYAESFNKSEYKKTLQGITPFLAKATHKIINQII
ncbi:MAG: 5'-methylthioadenosine/S-adenosylhomocysteine nucleosidase [Candidatus Cloacimonetes bacterium]|nr:5'-methylthioadenosine/S-adenosylhomocysteine nucleosidase [Candidatus Cloacimonadota bacterium]MBS3766712.1 5'-methylthioadenosine/S-adenosylhomocysteine nucleosidase [Candidatus Cloacimonadota bacterium]